MPIFFKPKLNKQVCSHMSLKDMVNKINENSNFFKGNKHIIIDKIREIKNKGSSGWDEINDAWSIKSEGESKRKIDKYFHEGTKVDSDLLINKRVKINLSDEGAISQPIGVKNKKISSAKNEGERPNFRVEARCRFKQVVHKIADKIDSKKESKRGEESEKINKFECDSFDDLINNLKKGEALSENKLNYIKFLMSYIRTREPVGHEDNIRKELENVLAKIIYSLSNVEDKNKVLRLYQEQRFLSVYNSSCRVTIYRIESLLEQKGFNTKTITKIKEYLINYSKEYLVKLKLNESKYDDYIKNIKKFADFEIFEGVESIDKIIFLKGILSGNKFTSEGEGEGTESSHNLKDERIISFIKEKINLDFGLLKSEYDKYITEKNEIIDADINVIKSILMVKKIPKSIIDSVITVINKERSKPGIELFSSKIDLIINMLQCKRIKINKITNDIKHYLNISIEQLKLEAKIEKSKRISFQGRILSLFNDLNNRMLNFIYNVRHSFK